MDVFVSKLNALHKAMNDKRDSLFKKLTKHKKVLAYSIQHKRDDADENRKIKHLMEESLHSMNVAVCRGSLICDASRCTPNMPKILDTNILEVMNSLDIKDIDFASKYDVFHKDLLLFVAENVDMKLVTDINIICLVLCFRKDISSINMMDAYDGSHLFQLLPKHRLHLFRNTDVIASVLIKSIGSSLDKDCLSGRLLSDMNAQELKNVCIVESRPYELHNLVSHIDNCLIRDKQQCVTLNGKTLPRDAIAAIHSRNVKAETRDMIIQNTMLCMTSLLKIYCAIKH